MRKLTIEFEETEDGITNAVHNQGFSPIEVVGLFEIVKGHFLNDKIKAKTLRESTGMKIPSQPVGDA